MDAERFACVLEQYPTSLPNRRLMYIDRLLREMPHKTRTEIVSMGSPHSAYPVPSQFIFIHYAYLICHWVSQASSFILKLSCRAGD